MALASKFRFRPSFFFTENQSTCWVIKRGTVHNKRRSFCFHFTQNYIPGRCSFWEQRQRERPSNLGKKREREVQKRAPPLSRKLNESRRLTSFPTGRFYFSALGTKSFVVIFATVLLKLAASAAHHRRLLSAISKTNEESFWLLIHWLLAWARPTWLHFLPKKKKWLQKINWINFNSIQKNVA